MGETLDVTWGDDEAEGPGFPPPSQEQVAYRALCLSGLAIRAGFEHLTHMWVASARDLSHPDFEGMHQREEALNVWLEREHLIEHQTERERLLFGQGLGDWGDQAVLDGTWRKESLGVLLWALSIAPALPTYDTEFSEQVHLEYVGWLKPAQEFLSRGVLRPFDEISHARDVAELWHWRSRTTALQRSGERPPNDYPKELNTYEKIIRVTAEHAFGSEDIPRPIKHDFPAFGKPYARLTEEEYSICTSIAMERHYALNWLCGYAEDWDNVPTDT